MKTKIATALFCLLFAYLLFAFILWEKNPAAWTVTARVLSALVFIILTGVVSKDDEE